MKFHNPTHLLEAVALAAVIVIVNLLPRRWSLAIGHRFGLCLYRVGIRRKVALENLARAFPEMPLDKRAHVAKRLYGHLIEFAVEFVRLGSSWKKDIQVTGEANLFAAHAAGRGAIILLAHLGNWELMGRRFAEFPFPCHVVAMPMQNPWVERYIRKKRTGAGLNVIYRKNALTGVVRALRANGFVGILMDQDAGNQGVFPTFFGHPASTVSTIADMAMKYGCAVLPVHLIRKSMGKYLFHIGEPVRTIHTGAPGTDRLVNTQNYNHVLENWIRQTPDQYFGWLHKRWKTRPR